MGSEELSNVNVFMDLTSTHSHHVPMMARFILHPNALITKWLLTELLLPVMEVFLVERQQAWSTGQAEKQMTRLGSKRFFLSITVLTKKKSCDETNASRPHRALFSCVLCSYEVHMSMKKCNGHSQAL
jgi:hypothetical protein